MTVRAIRGAIQIDADDRDAILEGTAELVTAVMTRNDLTPDGFFLAAQRSVKWMNLDQRKQLWDMVAKQEDITKAQRRVLEMLLSDT